MTVLSATDQSGHIPLCFGRNKPPPGAKCLTLKEYRKGALPKRSASVNYATKAPVAMAATYLNTFLGTCVVAALFRLRGVLGGNAGMEKLFTDRQALLDYEAIGGYVPGQPWTDRGCNEQDAMRFLSTVGWPDGQKLVAWAKVDKHDPEFYRTVLEHFENLLFGAEMADPWTFNVQSGFVWDKAPPNPLKGHAFLGVGFDVPGKPKGIQVGSWGLEGTITDEAIQNNVDELYVCLCPSIISHAEQISPGGWNWRQLVEDFNSIGGNVPLPPEPPPSPWPGSGPAPEPPEPPPMPIIVPSWAATRDDALVKVQQAFAAAEGRQGLIWRQRLKQVETLILANLPS